MVVKVTTIFWVIKIPLDRKKDNPLYDRKPSADYNMGNVDF